MNLYVRYFDHEYLAKSVDDALEFLSSIPEIKLESNAASRITTFLNSSNLYPFRLKVSYSNYVLFLKTEAENLEQFKESWKTILNAAPKTIYPSHGKPFPTSDLDKYISGLDKIFLRPLKKY